MKKLTLSLAFLFVNLLLFGQVAQLGTMESQPITHAHTEKCAFNHVHEQAMLNDPAYYQKTQDFEQFMLNYIPEKSAATYKIPVVIHVMETGTSMTQITDQQIKDAIAGLNARLRKLTGSLGDGNGVDVGIEYALAVRDPSGNCTNGIVRVNMTGNSTYMSSGVRASTSTGITEASLKATSVWDQSRYYNMWFVSELDGNNGSYGVQGFAYFASSHGTSLDGAVMTVNTIKSPDGTTLIHELGHSLDLYHTFEGDGSGNTCPTNSSCSSQGDRVCDTPPHKRSSSDCTTGTNTCTGTSRELFIHNYMDYSNDACQNMFTAGQQTRMQAAISTTRASFLESNGNMALVPVSAPSADFYLSRSAMCSLGQSVNFYDISSCSPNTFMAETAWTGCSYSWSATNNSGTTYTASVQNPVITFAVAGVYDVTFTITTARGSSTITKQGAIVVGTQSAPTACTPTSTNNNNYGSTLSNVTFNTINVSKSIFINKGYTDLSCTYNTVVAPNRTYPISVTVNSAGSGAEVFEAFIDYNADGDFLDAGEQVFTGSAANNASATVTGNVTIPAGATQDRPLRMRVYAEAGTLSTNEKNCSAALSIGDVHDFSIYVSAKVASVSIAASPGTTTTFGTNVTFTATPTNGGTTPTYAWYKNGTLIAGATASTYSTTTLVNADRIYCIMTSNLANVFASPASSNTLTMTVTGVPQSNFSASSTVGCTSTSFVFTDASTLAPTSWAWTFTGASPASSTSQNPTVTYAAAGTYTVILTASNGNGTGTTMTKTSYITVTAAPTAVCSPTRSLTPANGIGITKVVVNTINNVTANNDAVVNNFTCTKTTALTTGSTYAITTMGSQTVSQWTRAYIDYNNDGDFADAGENIFAPSNGVGTQSGSFTVPASPTLNTLLRMRVISDDLTTTPGSCTSPLHYGQAEDYAVLITLGCTPVIPSVAIASNDADNIFCVGTSVTFTATPTNGGTTPAYQWKVNGGNVGTNSNTYTNAALATGDIVTCVMTSNASCASPTTGTSTGITNTVNANVTPAVSIASNDVDNIICTGTSVTFTATPSNGGTTPSYQWKLNGGNVGTDATTYSNSTLANGDVVTCVMTSNATCASPITGTSSGITTTVNANLTPAVSIASNDADNSFCAGTSVTFTATPTNGGTTPSYQWKLNGGNVGTDATTYSNAAFANGDVVTCVMTSNATCLAAPTGTSSGITNTVNALPNPDAPANVTACDTYMLPALTVGNYFTGTGGTGTAHSAGDVISSTQTLYVYASNGSCSSENSFTIAITNTPSVTGTTPSAICGTGTVVLAATASSGTLNWYDASSGGTFLGTGISFTTPSISANTSFYVDASVGSCTSARTAVLATTNLCTQLKSVYCGRTLVNLNDYMACDAVPGATQYRFEVKTGATAYTYISATVGLRLNLIPEVKYGSTYSIRAAAMVGGVWMGYASACNVTTPLTRVETWYCNSTLSLITDYLACFKVQNATSYRFEINDGTNVYTYVSNYYGFRMSNFPNAKYETTYAVRAAAFVGGVWSAYGPACNITTPHTKVQPWYCGITVAPMSQFMSCYPVPGATSYHFQLFDGTNTLSYTSSNGSLRLSLVPGMQLNTTYTVSVQSYVNGAWTVYGDACNITSAASFAAMNQDQEVIEAMDGQLMEDFTIEAYPNPNAGNFVVSSNQDGEFILTNELGQVLRTISLIKENNRKTSIEGLGNGVYFISGTMDGETLTKKVMVVR